MEKFAGRKKVRKPAYIKAKWHRSGSMGKSGQGGTEEGISAQAMEFYF